jgi:TRAP-type mannitol/chloroaromatic compound transport system permease small subunit
MTDVVFSTARPSGPLLKATQTIVQVLDNVAEWTGRVIAWFTLAMMLLTCLVVAMRYGFGKGSIGLQESVMYLHGMVFMLGIAYTLKHQAHVRVDILYERFSIRARAIVDTLGTLLFLLPFSVFLLWISLDYVALSWSMKESSGQPGGLPGVFLLKTLLPVTALLILLQGLAELLRSFLVLMNRPHG